ncbi:fumarylacetoacetate hydrolase family protein [Alcaligenaceae bacterium]|nr:fumarylacetoacetate hydrolase family protein [Alcaligenaceae bacterium]
MNNQELAAYALELRTAYENGTVVPRLRDRVANASEQNAYAIQHINTQHSLNQGRRIVGYKAGLTSLAIQAQLGVSNPAYGVLFADMAYGDSEEISTSSLVQPKVEAEVALVLERDLNMHDATFADVINAVAYALPAIEVASSRIANWDIGLFDMVADNAAAGAFVLGGTPIKLHGLDLRQCGMVMEKQGEQCGVGAGAACMGHPLNAVVWLARTLARTGTPLQAGQVLMTGALGPMVAAQAGDVFETRINGLGSVRAVFSA